MDSSHSYRAVMAIPRFPGLLAASLLARLQYGMLGLAWVLLITDATGSYGTAGAVVAATMISSAVVGPQLGRFADKHGFRGILTWSTIAYCIAMVLAAVFAKTLGLWMIPCAVVFGAMTPPTSGAVRAMWGRLVPPGPMLDSVYAVEATAQELIFVVGPVITAVIATQVSPVAAIIVAAAVTAIGTGIFIALAPLDSESDVPVVHRHWTEVIRSPGFLWLLAASGSLIVIMNAIDLSVVRFAEHLGQKGSSGIALALWSAGSLTGGLVYGLLRFRLSLLRRFAVFIALMCVATALLIFPANLPLLTVFLAVHGFTIAPTIAVSFALVERITPAGSLTESFTWLGTAYNMGSALGAAVAGPVIQQSGADGGFLVGLAGGLLALVWIVLGRKSLSRAVNVPRERIIAERVPVASGS